LVRRPGGWREGSGICRTSGARPRKVSWFHRDKISFSSLLLSLPFTLSCPQAIAAAGRGGGLVGPGLAGSATQILEDEESLLQRLLDLDDRDDIEYLEHRLMVGLWESSS
jgi:hypothetical protein